MVLAAAAAMVSTAVAAADSVVSTADNDDKDWSALTRSLTAAASNETALVSGLLLTFKQLFLDPQEPGRGGEEIESLFSFSGTIGSPPLIEGSVMSNASSLSGLRLSLIPRLTKLIREWDDVLKMVPFWSLVVIGMDPKSDKTLETEGRHVLERWQYKYTHCLKITQIVASQTFSIWAFFINFCPIKIDLSGNTA